jgi:hypothetical protein
MYIRFNGFQAGGWGALQVVDMPSPEDDLEAQRTDILQGDGQVAGPDYLRGAVWNITLLVNTYSYEDGMAMVRQVKDAWQDPRIRRSSDLAPLHYSKDGEVWYTVYGRPTRYAGPPQGTRLDQGVAHIELQFEQLHMTHYSEAESETRINSVPGRPSRGWQSPFMFPLTAGYLSEPIDQSLLNEGNVPTPLKVTFAGPMTEPRLSNFQDDLVVGINGELRWDDRIEVDAFRHTVMHWRTVQGVRRPAPGRLIRQTRLSELYVPPGETDWQLRYTSADGGFVQLSIHSAYSSMQ